jgi:hypothetical protein
MGRPGTPGKLESSSGVGGTPINAGEIQNPNIEIRNKSKIRITKIQNDKTVHFGFSFLVI